MMLRYSFGMLREAKIIEDAIRAVLKDGFRTGDIYREGTLLVGTEEMGNEIVKKLKALLKPV